MTTGMRSSSGRALLLLGATMTIALNLAGCGGGSKSSSTSTTSSTSTSTSTTKSKHKHKGPAKFMIAVARSTSDKSAGSSVTAAPGDTLAFTARVLHSTSKTATITLTVPTASSNKLTLQASADGHTSKVAVTGSSGKSISLLRPRYLCSLPPTPSSCPASGVSLSHGTYTMKFTSPPKTVVTLDATVGPVSLKTPKSIKAVSRSVAPYSVQQLVKVLGKSGSSGGKASLVSSASASSGDSIEMLSRVTGKRGSPQPLTITFPAGASSTITISAQVKGGKASQATIKSASGSPIKLELPRYLCFLPPFPTFCPASSTKLASGRYTVVFNAQPGPAPPALQAKVAGS